MDNAHIIDFNIEDNLQKVFLGKKSDKYFLIDPSDMNAPIRMKDGIEKLETHFKKKAEENNLSVDNINTTSLATGDIEADIKTLKAEDDFVKSVVDEIFGDGTSDVVFGKANSLSIGIDGECYYEKFINAVLPLYEKTYQTRINKLSSRAELYMKKKGKYSK